MNCHHGAMFTDQKFHNLGLTYYGRKYEDLGRYHVTKKAEDVGRFKTPTLRNVMNTGPYMHNGLFQIRGVINMYDVGMVDVRRGKKHVGDPLFPVKDKLLHRINLSEDEKRDLILFLGTLSEPYRRVRPPVMPE